MARIAAPPKTAEAKRAYVNGYQRAMARMRSRVEDVLKIARGYRDSRTIPAANCVKCSRWTRGGPQCVWGYCSASFEYGVEPRMFAEGGRERICTTENFYCPNWIPNG